MKKSSFTDEQIIGFLRQAEGRFKILEAAVEDRQVLIIGGGIAGLVTSILLKIAGIPARIFEANPSPSTIGGIVTIFPNGMRVLNECCIKNQIINHGALITRALIQDQSGKRFANQLLGSVELYSEPTINIRRVFLHQLLIEQATNLGIEILYGKRLIDISQSYGRVNVAFQDGTSASGSILIGADGVNSFVRNHVVPDFSGPTHSGLTYFAGFVEDQSLIAGVDLNPNFQYVTVGPVGFFCYSHVDNTANPLPSLLWSCYLAQHDRVPSTELKAMPDEIVRQKVMDAHQGWHRPIVDLVERSASFCKANVFEVIGLERWSRGRVIVIGDAAHAMNPVAGQGANTAIEDSHLLVELLKFRQFPIERVFQEFEIVRKPRVTKMAKRASNSSKLSMIRVGEKAAWFRNNAYGMMSRISSDHSIDWRYSYETRNDIDKILKRL